MAEKAWGGVFDEATDRRVEKFTESVSFDRRLYAHDIRSGTVRRTEFTDSAVQGMLLHGNTRGLSVEDTTATIARRITRETTGFPTAALLIRTSA